MTTQDAMSFDELLKGQKPTPQGRIWMAYMGQFAPLVIEQPTPLQNNTRLSLK